MKKLLAAILSIVFISFNAMGQERDPYKIRPLIDVPIIAVGTATELIGLNRLNSKSPLDSAKIASLNRNDVKKFDRPATHTHRNAQNNTYSDVALYSSLATPFLLLINKNSRNHAAKIGVLYLQTLTITVNTYVWVVGSTHRIRPYAYDPKVPFEDKLNKKITNSFLAGHPFAAASATFFAAKVFNDYNPNSKCRKYIWAAAIVPPAAVAYFRYRNGEHFPTDIMLGIPLGAAIGILVPHLHKINTDGNVQLYPTPGGMGMTYRF